MELHAIWNRIDQLEQLIISQAKEIDLLRRALSTTQTITLQSDAKSPNGFLMTSDHHPRQHLAMTAADHMHSSTHGPIPACQQQQQSPNSSLYKSYLMNPFVHPPQAIPPVASRVIMRSENSSSVTSHQYVPVMRQSDLNRFAATGVATGQTTRTLPANTRWSSGPSLLGALPDVEPENDDRPAKEGGGRFNFFGELLTCFCPCFGMC